jgi:hypothetical protein
MWTRTQKFANVFAFLALDSVFVILWLAAWAALVAWVRNGIREGADAKKIDHAQANCTVFDPKTFGTPEKCTLGNACVGMGVTIWYVDGLLLEVAGANLIHSVFFIPTALISFLFLRKIQKEPENSQPWLGKTVSKGGEYAPADPEAGKDSAWSTDMHDDTGYGGGSSAPYDRPGSSGTEHGGDKQEDEYQLLHGAGQEGQGPTGNEYGPSAGHQYSLSAEDRLHERLDDDAEYYGNSAYGHDGRTDTNLPPYPSTPYGAHVEPYGGQHPDPYGANPEPYGTERPYSDRR